MTSSLVVIPTTGASTLSTAIESVLLQTYKNVELWVIIDGPEFEQPAKSILQNYPNVKYMLLPVNTGKPSWYGHRIYAAVSYLFNHDYISYLDQDNWFDPIHIESMIDHLQSNNLDWCHSLRKIYNADGTYVCDDDCESLGRYPIFLNDEAHLVDTSTYLIKRETILNLAPAWYSGWGGDRRFYAAISYHVPNFGCSKLNTVCYRLDGNPNSVNADFFIQGNDIMKQRYPGGFPWKI